jgi:hypothetical protein
MDPQKEVPKATDDATTEEVASSIFDAVNSYDEKTDAKEDPQAPPADGKPADTDQPSSQSAQQQQFLLQQQQMQQQFKQQQQQQFIQYQQMMASMTPQQQQLMQAQMLAFQQQ